MRDAGGGSIINFGSSYGLRCEPGFLAYAASKEAIRTLTRTAAREWGKYKYPRQHDPAVRDVAQGALVSSGEQVL